MLYKLTLHGFLFLVTAPNLRYLEINFDGSQSDRIPSARFLSLLATTPLLEEIIINGALRRDNPTKAFAGREVTLSHLQKLHYVDESGGLVFWRSVLAPPELAIRIELEDSVIARDLTLLFISMARHLRNPSYDSLSIRELQDFDESRISVNVWGSSQLQDDVEGRPGIIKPVGFSLKALAGIMEMDRDFETSHVLKALAPNLQITNIRHLDIADSGPDEYIDYNVWDLRPALIPFTGVETVVINSELGHIYDFDQWWGDDRDKMLFPALRHLIVQDLSAKKKMETIDLEQAWWSVHKILKFRASSGFPVPALTLTGKEISPDSFLDEARIFTKIDEEGLQKTRELVGKVVDIRGREGSAFWNGESNWRLAERATQLHPPLFKVLLRMLNLNLPYKKNS